MSGWRELMITIEVGDEGLVLDGIWQRGEGRGAVVAPPHPLMGGSMEHPVCNEVAYALHKHDIASVRFNWRGVGGSQGTPTEDVGVAERDYRAAVEHLAATVPGPVIAAGYSFGAATAVRVARHDDRIRNLILVAPPYAMLRELPLDEFDAEILVVTGARDEWAPHSQLQPLLEEVPHARLEVIPDVDHFFGGGLAELSRIIVDAF